MELLKNIYRILTYPYFLIKAFFTKIDFIQEIQNKKIILKCDDLNDLTKNVKHLNRIIKKYNIIISWGIIGKYLISPKRKYKEFLYSKINDNHYHFFNHGYYHNVGPDDYEFDGPDSTSQKKLIDKTNLLFFAITNKNLDTFGAPCNHVDSNTIEALSQVNTIKYWYYGIDNPNNRVLKRTINIEKSVGVPDYKFFLNQIKEAELLPNLLVLQCHPNAFKIKHFLQLILIIKLLLKNNCIFVSPDESY